jgi:hypothetical protein
MRNSNSPTAAHVQLAVPLTSNPRPLLIATSFPQSLGDIAIDRVP